MHALLRVSALVLIGNLLTVAVFGMFSRCDLRGVLDVYRRSEEFQHWRIALAHHRDGQWEAVGAWMAQRSTLMETMQRLQELDEDMEQAWPGYTRLVVETTKGTLEAWHHQFILDYIKDVLHDQPEEFARARRRLEKEHQQLQAGKKKGEKGAADGSE
jgi:hypothetical protein